MSLLRYYKGFKSVLGGFVTALAALPLIAKLLPEPIAKYAFPPLGDLEPMARIGTVGSVALATYVVYFLRSRGPSVSVLIASALAVASYAAYLGLSSMFVRQVPIPSEGTAVSVSVGYERTEFATRNFGDKTDWEMLRARGLGDEAIGQLWTPNSILIARMALWVSFSGGLIFAVAALGFGIISQQNRSG